MTEQNKIQQVFIYRLSKVIEDRGKRAALKRYWSPSTRHLAYPVLGGLGALDDSRKAILTALYAENPDHREGIGIGEAARMLGDPKDGVHPYDRHFRRLLACTELGRTENPGDLAVQLHRLIRRLAREAVGLDYADLLKRLNFWSGSSESVKVRWASQFWQSSLPLVTPTN